MQDNETSCCLYSSVPPLRETDVNPEPFYTARTIITKSSKSIVKVLTVMC